VSCKGRKKQKILFFCILNSGIIIENQVGFDLAMPMPPDVFLPGNLPEFCGSSGIGAGGKSHAIPNSFSMCIFY